MAALFISQTAALVLLPLLLHFISPPLLAALLCAGISFASYFLFALLLGRLELVSGESGANGSEKNGSSSH